MADVFDYLTWRGDLTWEQSPFNEVDGVILARFAYVPFEHFSSPLPDGFTDLGDMAVTALADGALRARPYWRLRDDEQLQAMAESRRFGDLGVAWPGSILDEQLQIQFSAVTVRLGDGRYAVLFRGTDNTVVGWKEDLNLSYLSPIPGQRLAAEYLQRIASKVQGRLIVCGHSKGGNLAVYAAAFCGEAVQSRIDAVYNYDGPGFFDNILQTEEFQRVAGRIHTFIPQSSVIGMLLGHGEGHTVVHSTESGLQQHDTYSWEVLGPAFVRVGALTEGSRFVDSTIKEWTKDMTPAQFQQFVDIIDQLLTDTKRQTVHEMKENWFDTAISFVRTVADMDETARRAAIEAVKLLARSAGREAVDVLQGV